MFNERELGQGEFSRIRKLQGNDFINALGIPAQNAL